MTPEQRSMQARLAALSRWANSVDRTSATQPARDALSAKFDAAAHPETARKAHMARMTLAASKKRTQTSGAKVAPKE